MRAYCMYATPIIIVNRESIQYYIIQPSRSRFSDGENSKNVMSGGELRWSATI